MNDVPIHGTCEPGFEAVRDAFEANFRERGDVGAAVCVIQGGRVVVDLWGGHRDAVCSVEWTPDTIVTTYSNGKGWLATCLNMLLDRGVIDLDRPVADYWPAFGAHGKGGVLVRHALTHTAGLPAPTMRVPDEAIYDFDRMLGYVADSELWWEPGTRMGYHAATFGWINGGILQHATGMSPGEFLRREIREPLGADLFWGTTPADDGRTATLLEPASARAGSAGAAIPESAPREVWPHGDLQKMALNNPPRRFRAQNTPEWRRACIPASNGHASARGLARMYGALGNGGMLDGVTLMSPERVRLASTEQVSGLDVVHLIPGRRSFGYALPGADDPRGLGAFGHSGLGGSLGYADLDHGIGFGYVMNQVGAGEDRRSAELSRALYASLGVPSR
ncbi:MAG: serine hydrolase [Chloroflexi bacterium]|nr:serine hydrolase [Chloroflexota bacterium]